MTPEPASTSPTPNSNEARRAQQARDWAVLEERLAFAASQAAGQIEGIFGPDSLSWRLLRESVGLASGASALMLQLAHPAVAAGVAQHSTLQRNPLGRARRTFYLMYQLIFGDTNTAIGAARRLHHMHQRVTGQVDADCGPQWAKRHYRASQPELQRWVWATLVRSAVIAHEGLIRLLTRDEKERHYAETKLAAALFGIPEDHIPPTLNDFDVYYAGMLAGPELVVGETARNIAHYLFNSPYTAFTRLDELLTAAFLPPEWRRAYGLRWTQGEERRHAQITGLVRRTLPYVPAAVRYVPAYHQATLRVALARGERVSRTCRLINRLDRRMDLPLSLRPVPETPPRQV